MFSHTLGTWLTTWQMSLTPAVQELVDKWLKWDKNPQNIKEIHDLVAAKNETELKNRLATRIAFGTAGLYTYPPHIYLNHNVRRY
jgi:hypothetical protein